MTRTLRRFQCRPLVASYERLRAEVQAAGRGEAEGVLAELEGLDGSRWSRAALLVAAGLYRKLVEGLLAHGTKATRVRAAEFRGRLSRL